MKTVLVAKALVIDDDHNCLVLRRSKTHPHAAFKPDLPGGELDSGETPQVAVIREISEETGLTIEPSQVHLVFATTTVDHGMNFVRFLVVARVSETKPDVHISWEHDKAWWTPVENIANELTHPEYLAGIKHITKYDILKDILAQN